MQYTAAVGGQPQAAVRRDFDIAYIVGAEGGLVLLVEDGETDAVEARQAILCTQPEVALWPLAGYPDSVRRQPVLAPEAVVQVLAGQTVGIKPRYRCCRGYRQQQPGGPEQGLETQLFQFMSAVF